MITKARKSIAAFKLREGMPIGCAVTLRGDRMYEFLDRLVNVALPRVRDFRGVSSKSFDGRGNYTLGMKDQLIFPEIDYNKVEKTKGMNICITTTAKTDAEGLALLKHLGMPFEQVKDISWRLLRKLHEMKNWRSPRPTKTPKLRCRHRNRCFRCGRPRGLFAKIQAVPHLFPEAGAGRGSSRRDQGQLVEVTAGGR